MHTTVLVRQRRRRHSAQFKAEAVAACCQPGVSIASVALSRGLNANLLRRWIVQAEKAGAVTRTEPSVKALAGPMSEAERFVPVTVTEKPVAGEPRIRVEVRRGATVLIVEWPPSAARECAQWLRKFLK